MNSDISNIGLNINNLKSSSSNNKEQVISLNEKVNAALNNKGTNAVEKNVTAKQPKENISETELSAAIEIVSDFIAPQIRNVNFAQDESSGKTVVKVFDSSSKELIRQFPSAEILELAEKIQSLQHEIADKTGILLDEKI